MSRVTSQGFGVSVEVRGAFMKYFVRLFTATKNRRLNELIGFLLFVSAIVLFLALASYSPLDPSLNTAGSPPLSHPARNWIGLFGAMWPIPWQRQSE